MGSATRKTFRSVPFRRTVTIAPAKSKNDGGGMLASVSIDIVRRCVLVGLSVVVFATLQVYAETLGN